MSGEEQVLELEHNQLELANTDEIPESEVVYEGWSFGGGERDFGDAVEVSLLARGFEVERECRTPSGPADIHAYQSYGHWKVNHHFIELKMRSDRRTAAHALGQLLFYQSEYISRDKCGLWFASPMPPSERTLKVLAMHGIRWCDAAAEGFEAWPESEVKQLVEQRDKNFMDMFLFGGSK